VLVPSSLNQCIFCIDLINLHLLCWRIDFMVQTLDIQSVETVLVVDPQRHNPAIVKLEFLRCSNIISPELEPVRAPVNTPQAAQILFQNGIAISAQANQVIFSEALGVREPETATTPEIASRYIETLPNSGYQAVGMSFRGFVVFPEQGEDAAHRYLTQRLLAPGSWQNYGQAPVRSSVNYVYTLEGLMFSANVEYLIEDGNPQLLAVLAGWRSDLNVYKELVNTHFLSDLDGEMTNEIPSLYSAQPSRDHDLIIPEFAAVG
jgi:hypothetical protein